MQFNIKIQSQNEFLFLRWMGLLRFIVITSLLIGSCSEDEPTPVKLVPSTLYSSHITSFYQEAALRSVDVPQITPEVRFTNNAEFKKDCTSDSGGKVTSLSYKQGDKYIIEITDWLEDSENASHFELPIFREMAHLLLNKAYEPYPWLEADVSAINPMCQCASQTIDWNGQRQLVLDYLFQ